MKSKRETINNLNLVLNEIEEMNICNNKCLKHLKNVEEMM